MDLRGKALKRECSWRGKKKARGEEQNSVRGCVKLIAPAEPEAQAETACGRWFYNGIGLKLIKRY